jgi:ferredoxin-like protein FixX
VVRDVAEPKAFVGLLGSVEDKSVTISGPPIARCLKCGRCVKISEQSRNHSRNTLWLNPRHHTGIHVRSSRAFTEFAIK